MQTSFYSEQELKKIGFKTLGKNVYISKKASIYGANNISIGDNVRIDDFCILSGLVTIGNYIHIAAYTALFGGKYGIELEDFVTISSRNVIYAESDDYVNASLTNPLIGEPYRKTYGGKVVLKRHSLIGTGCTTLPNVVIETGVSVGAMSLINRDLQEWKVYAGIPAKYLKDRDKNIVEIENNFLFMEEIKNGKDL